MFLNKLIVPTMKVAGNNCVPDVLEVETPFSVGQELYFEYDIHNKKMQSEGYGGWTSFSQGKDIGHFRVSGIYANMLISPPKTMIEVVSLDEKFDRIYPSQKTMIVEQESLFKRIRTQSSLEVKIQSATTRSGDSHTLSNAPAKSQESER